MNDNMDQWTRYLRIHMPKELSIKPEGDVYQIPWGFGLGAIAASGAQITSVFAGKQSFTDAMRNIWTQIALDSFVPVPVSRMKLSADNLPAFALDSIMPSSLRPVVEFIINKNGLGNSIYNDANRRMGDAFLGGDNIPEIYKDASQALFYATDGAINWNPNSLYFLSNSYVDGIGRMVEYGYGVTDMLSGRKSFNPKTDVPLIGSFFGSKSNVDAREFADFEKKIQDYAKIGKGMELDIEKQVEYDAKYPFRASLVDYYYHTVGAKLDPLRAEANQIRADRSYLPADREVLLRMNKLEQNLIKNEMLENFKAYEPD
jgi:hypothetical protein